MDLEIAAAKTDQEIREERERERERESMMSTKSASSVNSVARLIQQSTANMTQTLQNTFRGSERSPGAGHNNNFNNNRPSAAGSSLYASTVGSPLLSNAHLDDMNVTEDGWRTHTSNNGTARASFHIGGPSIDRTTTI